MKTERLQNTISTKTQLPAPYLHGAQFQRNKCFLNTPLVSCGQQPQLQTLPLLTPPLCTVCWFTKTEPKTNQYLYTTPFKRGVLSFFLIFSNTNYDQINPALSVPVADGGDKLPIGSQTDDLSRRFPRELAVRKTSSAMVWGACETLGAITNRCNPPGF